MENWLNYQNITKKSDNTNTIRFKRRLEYTER